MLSQRALLVVSFAVVLTCACGNHNYQGGGRRHELPISDGTAGTSPVTAEGDSDNGQGGAPAEEGVGGSAGTGGNTASAGTAGSGGSTGGFSGGPGLQ